MKKFILFFLAFVGIVCGINSYMIHVYPDERMELKAQAYELIYGIRGVKGLPQNCGHIDVTA